jgi:hypothetical protein
MIDEAVKVLVLLAILKRVLSSASGAMPVVAKKLPFGVSR